MESYDENACIECTGQSLQATRLRISRGDAHGTGRVPIDKEPEKVVGFKVLFVYDTCFYTIEGLINENLIKQERLGRIILMHAEGRK